ncbi:unnamed protein product [Rotaria sp. Silwood1]|nr:unnamed protein product [Rotaria sp. Silwood1]CAF1619949.1 unnamed protein product [Rotaria sp. Silwood1]
MENLVRQVDHLDTEINVAKGSIVQGVTPTEQELNLLFAKITRRALLNHELEQVRAERNSLRDRLNQHQ